MKRVLAILVGLMVVVGFVSMGSAQDLKLILATGGTAGTYYPFGGSDGENLEFQDSRDECDGPGYGCFCRECPADEQEGG